MRLFRRKLRQPQQPQQAPRPELRTTRLLVSVYDKDGFARHRLARFALIGDTWRSMDELVFEFRGHDCRTITGVAVGMLPERPLDYGSRIICPGSSLVFHPGDITLDSWVMEIHSRLMACEQKAMG